MNRNWRVGIVAGALLALASFSAEARPVNEPGVVAILPAVSVVGDAPAETRAEAGWMANYGRGATQWLSADEVRRRMAISDPSGDLAHEVREQIWRNGAVDEETAARLCKVLGANAVLSLRVDRWETAERRGMVAMTASLSGADGPELWSASDAAGFGRRELPDVDAQEHPDHRTCAAYSALLARWAIQLPASMQQELISSVVP